MRLVIFSTKGPYPTKYYVTVSKSKKSELECSYRKAPNTVAHQIITWPHGYEVEEQKSRKDIFPTMTKEQKSAVVTGEVLKMRGEGKLVLNTISAADMLNWYSIKHPRNPTPISFYAIWSRSLRTCFICYTQTLVYNAIKSLNLKHKTGPMYDLMHADDREVLFLDMIDSSNRSLLHPMDNQEIKDSHGSTFQRRHEYWLRNYHTVPQLAGLKLLNHVECHWGTSPDGPRFAGIGDDSGTGSCADSVAVAAMESVAAVECGAGGGAVAVAAEIARKAAYDKGVSDFGIVFRNQQIELQQKKRAHEQQCVIEFWLFQSADRKMNYIAQIDIPPSSIEIYMERAQHRKHQKNYSGSKLSQILRTQPDGYTPTMLKRMNSPTNVEVLTMARLLNQKNDRSPKVILIRNDNSVFVASTMNQSTKEMEQRWRSRWSSFKRDVGSAKFDRAFEILKMEGEYELEVVHTFPKDATSAEVKAALKAKVKALKAEGRWNIANLKVGNSKMPTEGRNAKFTFYRIYRPDTNECYIGRTTKNIEFRLSDHHTKKFKKAYASYVLFRDDNFQWEILSEQELASEQEADRIESEYIRQYQPHVVNLVDPLTRKRIRPDKSRT